jgi:hypothetical protein
MALVPSDTCYPLATRPTGLTTGASASRRRPQSAVARSATGLRMGRNFFKANLVMELSKGEQTKVRDHANLPKPLRTHNLKALAGLVRLEISEEERQALETLERAGTWSRRYPVPLSHCQRSAERFQDARAYYSNGGTWPEQVSFGQALIERIRSHAAEEIA